MDEPTADMSRPDLARVCVEIDLTAHKVQALHLQINGKTYRQQVVYENCPPYCTFCNHLGDDMFACITKHHTGTSHTDKEPRPPDAPAAILILMLMILLLMKYLILNCMYPSLNPLSNQLARDMWRNEKSERTKHLPFRGAKLIIRRELTKGGRTTRNFFRGETSRQRCTGDHSPEMHLAPLDSEGEEELNHLSNRFQSLEDMEMDDMLQLIESTQNTASPAKYKETGGSNVDARAHHTSENTFSTEHPIQEGDASQQEIIFTDSTVSNKHKRIKSHEEARNKSPKMGVKRSWCCPIEGYGMYKLQQKLYRTKELLKQWNRDTFGNVFTAVQQAKHNATEVEKKFDRDPSEENLIALNQSNAELVHALSLESEYWRQKSNCKWLEDGNPNRHDIPNFPFQFSQLLEEAPHNIYNIPEMEEIKDIIFSIHKESVAGPDGFSSAFYQACWAFIAIDIQDAVRDFFCGLDLLFNENLDMYYQTRCDAKISHLSYADDIILFTKCKEDGLTKLMQFLRKYEELSGQKINLAKSAFIPGKRVIPIAQRIKITTGFSMKSLPITYLGAPLFKGHKRKILYADLTDKVRAKISGWKHCHRSYKDRLQLIKFVLSSMPIYLLQVLNPPALHYPNEAQENIFWSLGAGTASFWYGWWIPEGTLANLLGTQCNLHIPVNWFWNNQGWDVNKLQQAVP
ncbi:UNVERIFIED_CONTAM: hypothetical protein Slati_1930600 [Sesamum latifolium]|uniref:Reverse transcriptase domain-containing protein n=1 Tax=Sesamum latifolium TaxID=2727402 RepID=A0AAW2X1U2_9LAMI